MNACEAQHALNNINTINNMHWSASTYCGILMNDECESPACKNYDSTDYRRIMQYVTRRMSNNARATIWHVDMCCMDTNAC